MSSVFPDFLSYQLYAPLILRLVLGTIFIIHGYPKLFKEFSKTAEWFGSIGLKPGKLWVFVVGVVEFFGGILLLVGFLTQVAAILIAINMIGAMVFVKFKQGLVGGYEFDLVLLAMALALLFLGAGFYAFDYPF